LINDKINKYQIN